MSELARIETVMVLQSVELLSSCSAEQILRISAITRESLFEKGAVLYRKGDVADVLYFVVRGSVQLTLSDGTGTPLGPGETFGAIEILSGRLRSALATATEDTLVLAIEADDFFDLLANNIEIVKALFRQFLERSGFYDERSDA